MLTIRRFEERVVQEFNAGNLPGFVHSYIGEEAIATGVCAHLGLKDRIVSHHRGHGHCIAKGADMKKMMAEIYGKKTGYCKGKGGSMHIADFSIGMLGADGIVAAGLPIATGAAFAQQLEKKGTVVCHWGFHGQHGSITVFDVKSGDELKEILKKNPMDEKWVNREIFQVCSLSQELENVFKYMTGV